MTSYIKPQIWNIIWSRSYVNYKSHHQVFWEKIRGLVKGKIVDLACGSSSCFKDFPCDLIGVDFSFEAVKESRKNCPFGYFYQSDIRYTQLTSSHFDTVILTGVVNYYKDLIEIMAEARRLVKPGGIIIITINVIDDFPSRHWDKERIQKEFGRYGKVNSEFYKEIGWLIVISI